MFNGLLEAMVQKHDREDRGIGLQNFKYAPAWDEFCHIVNIHSPRAYRALRHSFPAPTQRNFKRKEAKEPHFPQEINNQTFQLVVDHLDEINYNGPCSLSCDDTKLFSTYRLYYDGKKNAHFLVGGVDGPIKVLDPENMKEVIAQSKDKKAVKVRFLDIDQF